ncbi:MAG: YheV family putative metal-binding protein, partial [Gammaproteobacteria bacterium]|nr:YheV family putative metal-binding protein [Gammaproteobacteria bacterium]MBT7533757.1 YheV family putative metal-binding protein [Gammaproteobacteria bacterium]
GATCPSCGQIDKIYVLKDDDRESMHCSRCDYIETKKDDNAGIEVQEWSPINLPDK